MDSPFARALAEEEKWLADVRDRLMPDDPRAGHRVYLGPTRTPGRSPAAVADTERRLMANWRSHDLARFYAKQV